MDECVIPQLIEWLPIGLVLGEVAANDWLSRDVRDNKVAQHERVQNECLRLQLIRGMERLAEGSNGRILSGLAQTLVLWMCESASPEVISMCAVATMHKKNAITMAYNDAFVPAIMDELTPGLESHNRDLFYRIVRLITNLCKNDVVVLGGAGVDRHALSRRGNSGRRGHSKHGRRGAQGKGHSHPNRAHGGRKTRNSGAVANERVEYRSAGKFVKSFFMNDCCRGSRMHFHQEALGFFPTVVFRDLLTVSLHCLHSSGMFNLLRPENLTLRLFQIYTMVEQTGKHVHPMVSSVINALLVVLRHDLGAVVDLSTARPIQLII